MYKLFSWITTIAFWMAFFVIICILHVCQVIALKFFPLRYTQMVDILNSCLLWSLRIVGVVPRFENTLHLPDNRPILLVSNHQCMFDPVLLHCCFRTQHPRFVAKIELGKGLPAISHNLRNGGSILIDRKDPRQAFPLIERLGKTIHEKNWSVVIFPEGTRARDGVMKSFKAAGILALLRQAPNALIVPVTIDGSWLIQKNNGKPIPFGQKVTVTALSPIEPSEHNSKELVEVIEERIRHHLQKDPLVRAA